MKDFQLNLIPDIFKNRLLQENFDRDGYVIISFLSNYQIEALNNLFKYHFPEVKSNMFGSSTYLSDYKIKRIISDSIDNIIGESLDNYFKNFTAFGSAFLYKTPGPQSELCAHQDWTIVDEMKAIAVNIWFPLIDTNIHNGTLSVLPKSHSRNLMTYRSPTLPFFFQGNDDIVLRNMTPLDVNAGQAVVLNQSLIHYSCPNLSDKIRVSITSGIKTEQAEMIFLYKDKMDKHSPIEKYFMDDYFMQSFSEFFKDIQSRPKNYRHEKFSINDQKVFSREELKCFLKQLNG
jgi:hypothetical protein